MEQNFIDLPKKSDPEADLWIDCSTGVDSGHFIAVFVALTGWLYCCLANSCRDSEIERVNPMSRNHTHLIDSMQVVKGLMNFSSSD